MATVCWSASTARKPLRRWSWIAFWPERYKRDRIVPWREEEDGVFRDFLENHFKKIVALSAKEGDGMADLPAFAPPLRFEKQSQHCEDRVVGA